MIPLAVEILTPRRSLSAFAASLRALPPKPPRNSNISLSASSLAEELPPHYACSIAEALLIAGERYDLYFAANDDWLKYPVPSKKITKFVTLLEDSLSDRSRFAGMVPIAPSPTSNVAAGLPI